MSPSPLNHSGAWVIDKPIGLSSSQVVSRLKWALTQRAKSLSRDPASRQPLRIGHGGTLDPFATGVLVVLVGEGTKLADCYLHSKKTYTGDIILGTGTDSGDPTGEVNATAAIPDLSLTQWQGIADSFVKEPYFQTPPMHSAKKRDGVALYDLARQGKEVPREAIKKRIESFTLAAGKTPNTLSFEVTCESGTYVRVLAEDLAKKAGTVAHLGSLRRTASSDRSIRESLDLEECIRNLGTESAPESFSNFIPLDQLATHVPGIEIEISQSLRIRQGQTSAIEDVLRAASSNPQKARYLRVRDQGSLVALLERIQESSIYRLQRVFNGGSK